MVYIFEFMRAEAKKIRKMVWGACARQKKYCPFRPKIFVTDRQTDRQILWHHVWVCVDFSFKLNLLPPYSLRSQGDKNCWHTHSTVKILLEITVGDCRLLSHVLQNAAKEQKYSFRSVREISLQQGGILPFVQLSINCVVVVSQMKNILFIL